MPHTWRWTESDKNGRRALFALQCLTLPLHRSYSDANPSIPDLGPTKLPLTASTCGKPKSADEICPFLIMVSSLHEFNGAVPPRANGLLLSKSLSTCRCGETIPTDACANHDHSTSR